MQRLKSFQQLEVWQEAHKLVLQIYQITQQFPPEEKYGLTSQIRRAAISVPANVAEGFKRRGIGERSRFYNIAEGSLEEVKCFFILAEDLHYVTSKETLMDQANCVGRLLNGLIGSTRRRQ